MSTDTNSMPKPSKREQSVIDALNSSCLTKAEHFIYCCGPGHQFHNFSKTFARKTLHKFGLYVA